MWTDPLLQCSAQIPGFNTGTECDASNKGTITFKREEYVCGAAGRVGGVVVRGGRERGKWEFDRARRSPRPRKITQAKNIYTGDWEFDYAGVWRVCGGWAGLGLHNLVCVSIARGLYPIDKLGRAPTRTSLTFIKCRGWTDEPLHPTLPSLDFDIYRLSSLRESIKDFISRSSNLNCMARTNTFNLHLQQAVSEKLILSPKKTNNNKTKLHICYPVYSVCRV